MINESSHPTTFNIIKSNLRNKNKQIHILIFCLSICVFVQSLLIGLSVGIENELAQRPEIFDNGVNFFEAVGGWTRTLFGIVSLIIVVTLLSNTIFILSTKKFAYLK